MSPNQKAVEVLFRQLHRVNAALDKKAAPINRKMRKIIRRIEMRSFERGQ